MSSIQRTGFEEQAAKLTHIANEVLSKLPRANKNQLRKIIAVYASALDMDPRSKMTLLSRAKAHISMKR